MGKQFGPIARKVCDDEHQGALCTKFNSVKVLALKPAAQPKSLALPAPKARSSAVEPPAHNGLVAGSKPAAPTKAKSSPKRKTYLAAKAQERRNATKAGLNIQAYRIQQAENGRA